MRDDISSKSLGTASELLVIADMKSEFVPIRDSITYATRLRILLRTLNAIRKVGLEEKKDSIYVGPIDRLQTIYHVRWTVFEENRKMLLAVTFDRGLEPYIRRIVNVAGPVLDAILCHCKDYENSACWQGHDGFARWATERQVDVDLYGASAPRLTVDDMTYLTELERMQRSMPDPKDFERAAARLAVQNQSDKMRDAMDRLPKIARQQALDLIRAMYRLREYFPEADGDAYDGCDAFYLHRLTKALVYGFDSGKLTKCEVATYRPEVEWFRGFERREPGSGQNGPARPAPGSDEIQGGIVTGHGRTSHGCMMLMRFGNAADARRFLRQRRQTLLAAPKVRGGRGDARVFANLALTYGGLRALGLSEPVLRRFPKVFRAGMEERAGQLGDIGVHHPKHWSLPCHPDSGLPVRMSSVDLVVQLQTMSSVRHSDLQRPDHPLFDAVAEWRSVAESCDVEILAVESQKRTWDNKTGEYALEHFGFRDGISQPHFGRGTVTGSGGGIKRDRVPLGDVLLGYDNSRGDPASDRSGELDALFDNGSYLVVRKLEQDVGAFRRFLKDNNNGISKPKLAAKMMGREFLGKPLVAKGTKIGKGMNDFDFSGDEQGDTCPLHAHIRRANPRTPLRPASEDVPTPRLLRRGFSYGSRYSRRTAHEPRGLFFMAYCASIAEQFEVIQSWINGANSTGVFSHQSDALIGARQSERPQALRFLNKGKVHKCELPDHPFVTLQWGLYLFVPSMSALDLLSNDKGKLPTIADERVKRGLETIGQLRLYQYAKESALGEDASAEDRLRVRREVIGAWKALLEDPSGEDLAEEVWAVVRAHGGVLQSPYGVLVGDLANVKKVFKDDGSNFSTREYWRRMRGSIGELYLGLDPEPAAMPTPSESEDPARDSAFEAAVSAGDYQALAAPTNGWIVGITEQDAFDCAVRVARDWFASDLRCKPDSEVLELKDYIADIVGRLSVEWFGLPTDGSIDIGGPRGSKPNTPDDLVSASYFFFGPRPTPHVIGEGLQRGKALKDAIIAHVSKHPPTPGTLDAYLRDLPPFKGNVDLIARMLAGCTNGFVAATRGSFLSVMRRWIDEEDLWKLRHGLRANMAAAGQCDATHGVAAAVLREALVIGMQKRARPNLLHRVAMKKMRLGQADIEPGQVVVVSLQSAAEEQPGNPELLFGGNYGDTTHACSGQQMALGVLLGAISVIMERPVLEPDATFSLSLTHS